MQRQIEKLVRNRVIDKGVKMAARSWMKLVPGLNILSTAYDIVDTAITAVDIYDTIRNSSQIADEAVRIRPDFAIQNDDGSRGQIYDFMRATQAGYAWAAEHPDEAADILIAAGEFPNADLVRGSMHAIAQSLMGQWVLTDLSAMQTTARA